MDYSVENCAVRAVFFAIVGSEAVEGAPFLFQVAVGVRRSLSPLKRALSFDSTISGRGPRATELSAFFCTVWGFPAVIFVCKAVEETSFASQTTLGFGTRLDLHRDMIEDRAIGFILPKKEKKGCQDPSDFRQDIEALKGRKHH
jgi:hypothetical protein